MTHMTGVRPTGRLPDTQKQIVTMHTRTRSRAQTAGTTNACPAWRACLHGHLMLIWSTYAWVCPLKGAQCKAWQSVCSFGLVTHPPTHPPTHSLTHRPKASFIQPVSRYVLGGVRRGMRGRQTDMFLKPLPASPGQAPAVNRPIPGVRHTVLSGTMHLGLPGTWPPAPNPTGMAKRLDWTGRGTL